MEQVYIVEGARTAVGAYAGGLAAVPAHVLGATAIVGALERAQADPAEVDDVILGCVGQVGPQAFNARLAALEAGVPASANAFNVNRLCGSGLQAIWTAATQIRVGDSRVVVAGGNENMSSQPMMDFSARAGARLGHRTLIDGTLSLVTDPWSDAPMGVTAENVANEHGVTRARQDAFALESQRRAAAAQDAGRFAEEIVPVEVVGRRSTTVIDTDEHLRRDADAEALGRLRPAFADGGSVTAGNSSGINDGAGAVVVMSAREIDERGLEPLARIASFAKGGIAPEVMGFAPAIAIPRALEGAGVSLADVGVVELNEAFAAQAVAVADAVGIDPDVLNPLGGAIALGHPVGATGAILALRAAYEMRRAAHRYGVVSLCIGGGQGVAMVLERP